MTTPQSEDAHERCLSRSHRRQIPARHGRHPRCRSQLHDAMVFGSNLIQRTSQMHKQLRPLDGQGIYSRRLARPPQRVHKTGKEDTYLFTRSIHVGTTLQQSTHNAHMAIPSSNMKRRVSLSRATTTTHIHQIQAKSCRTHTMVTSSINVDHHEYCSESATLAAHTLLSAALTLAPLSNSSRTMSA